MRKLIILLLCILCLNACSQKQESYIFPIDSLILFEKITDDTSIHYSIIGRVVIKSVPDSLQEVEIYVKDTLMYKLYILGKPRYKEINENGLFIYRVSNGKERGLFTLMTSDYGPVSFGLTDMYSLMIFQVQKERKL